MWWGGDDDGEYETKVNMKKKVRDEIGASVSHGIKSSDFAGDLLLLHKL